MSCLPSNAVMATYEMWATAEIKVPIAIKVAAKTIFLTISMDIQAFLLAIPTRPSRPEPKSQTAAGTGTADVSNVHLDPLTFKKLT